MMDSISLQIPENFLDEEVRSGYLVSEKQKKIWAVELDLLCEFDRVCKKYSIKYVITGGTLLGAVRHKGFIPWDDDLDVALDRDSYERLLSIADKEFRHPYFFQTAFSDRKYFLHYARLRNSNTTGVIRWDAAPDYNNGIYIDIYAMDGYTDDSKALRRQKFDMKFRNRIINDYIFAGQREIGLFRKLEVFLLQHTLFKLIKYETVIHWYYKAVTRYNCSAERIANLMNTTDGLKKYNFLLSEYNEVSSIQFEFLTVPAPADYNSVLSRMYGEYLSFPPVEERGAWHEDSIKFEPDMSYKEYFEKNGNPFDSIK